MVKLTHVAINEEHTCSPSQLHIASERVHRGPFGRFHAQKELQPINVLGNPANIDGQAHIVLIIRVRLNFVP